MSTHTRAGKGVYADNHEEFICDHVSDVSSLPTNGVVVGSIAFIIENGKRMIFTSDGKWVDFHVSGGGSSGGGSIDESLIATNEEINDMLNEVFPR